MGKFSEMPGKIQWLVLLAAGGIISVALYFTVFASQRDANEAVQKKLTAKLAENHELEAYKPKLVELDRQVANLKQQLEIQSRIVPDEKQADQFMHVMEAEADRSGIEIRRYTAKATTTREFYTEVPFEIELDGPYYSMLNFFEHVSKAERIINISNLLLSTVKKPSDAKTRHQYNYAPGESVVATAQAVTFFSHDTAPPAAKPGAPGAKR
jgi:type IV pilus assembly protein PilO